ncbi:MAG TPA: MauE/DoxX family redox-associated membrane protein [Actinocatenispora sp.]
MTVLTAAQPLLLAGVFVVSARVKLTGRDARRRAAGTALARLVGKDRAPLAYGVVGAVEAAAAVLLLAGGIPGVPHRIGAVASVALAAGFLGYLLYARLFAPDSSCGCVSARQSPITWRSYARAGVLLAAALAAVSAGTAWPAVLAGRPYAAVGVVVVEGVAVLLLSPEADERWLFPLRRLKTRIRPHPLAGLAYDLPLASTLRQLEASDAYRQVGTRLRSDVLEYWDEGEWRIVSYRADADATAVFAVPRLRYDPGAVRVAVVDDPEPVPV